MSSLSIVTFDKEGKINTAKRFRNSHLFYSLVWSELQEHYLGKKDYARPDSEWWSKTWQLVKDERLSYCEKIVLGMTFDYAVIRQEQFSIAIQCLKDWTLYNQGGHAIGVADALTTLALDENVVAVGFQHSISDQWYQWGEPNWIEESGEEEPDEVLYFYDLASSSTYYPIDTIPNVPVKDGWLK